MKPDPYAVYILLVDDEAMILNFFPLLLGQFNYHSDHCTTSAEALERIRLYPGRYDLLISNIQLQDGDGIELVRKARALVPDLPAMFMTDGSSSETQQRALALGRVELLEKPFAFVEQLQEAIAQFLTRQ